MALSNEELERLRREWAELRREAEERNAQAEQVAQDLAVAEGRERQRRRGR